MNGTMLSQIVWVMTLAHYRLLKVAEMCQKKAKSNCFAQFTMCMGPKDSDLDYVDTVSLAGCYTLESFKLFKFFCIRFKFHSLKLPF